MPGVEAVGVARAAARGRTETPALCAVSSGGLARAVQEPDVSATLGRWGSTTWCFLLLTFAPCPQVWVLAGACQPLLRQLRPRSRPGHQRQRQ